MVVVPTRNSGRNLRACILDQRAAEGRPAVLGPRIVMPNHFFRLDAPAPDSVRWAGWLAALRHDSARPLEELFPAGMTDKGEAWKLSVVRQIEQARETLAAACLGFREVAAGLGEDAERWAELASLEADAVAAWGKWGHADPVTAKLALAAQPPRPAGVDEIVVAAVPDPNPLALRAWQALADGGLPVTVLIGAPESLRGGFDEWGRPDPAFWADRERHAAPEPTTTLVAANAKALAQAVVQVCAGKSNLCVAVGACDRSFLPAIERELREHGWDAFDPEDAPVPKDGWPDFLEALAAAVEKPDQHDRVGRLARHPFSWKMMEDGADLRDAVAALDRRAARHPTEGTREAVASLSAGRPDELDAGRLLEGARGMAEADWKALPGTFASLVLPAMEADSPEVADRVRSESGAWSRLLEDGIEPATLLRWLALSVSSVPRRAAIAEGAIPLQGWLELSFDPAPDLVLAGMHEGAVPEAAPAGALLSEAVFQLPGLRDRRARLARDVFLYTAMVEGRRREGSVSVVIARFDARGEPCKPSRILLHAGPNRIPARVIRLVEKPDRIGPGTPPWGRESWILGSPAGYRRNREWDSLSPTILRDYLTCPTRFYFKRVLGWREFQPFEGELDAGGYGDLLHEVLKAWGRDPKLRELDDAAKLRKCWDGMLQDHVREAYGEDLPPMLALQVISAGERLAALAPLQAGERIDGWRVIEAEKEFNGILSFAGLPLNLKVDRIDRNEGTGRLRIVDYKTGQGDKEGPRRAHLHRWNEETCGTPLGALVAVRGRDSCWTDLQLPLYVATVGKALGAEECPVACYAVLPEALSGVGFRAFDELESCLDSALEWAEVAAGRIAAGKFWPPVRRPMRDPFAAIAPEGLEDALGGAWGAFLS